MVMQRPDWITVRKKKRRSAETDSGRGKQQAGTPAIAARNKNDLRMRRSPTTPKQTPLSRDNSKVVIRPRCSFEATWLHAVAVTDVLLSVTNEAARKNALSMDAQYKRLTVSLPSQEKRLQRQQTSRYADQKHAKLQQR
ncbi:hypothetical protein MTO96_041115 [Rhipicephalus appendiculatus]